MAKKKKSVNKSEHIPSVGEDIDDDSLDSALQKAWHKKLENMIVYELPSALRDIRNIKDRLDILEDVTLCNGCNKLNGHLKMHKFVYWLISILIPIIVSVLMMLLGNRFSFDF